MLTFRDIINEVLATLDESGDTGTTLTLVKYYINQAHENRLGSYNWPFLRWSTPETLTMSSATRLYAVHTECWKPLYFYNRTQKYYMTEVPERNLEASGIDWNNDTGGRHFRFSEIWPVVAQPSSSSVITIVSSSASDTTAAKAITIKGQTANGVTTESITPNGETPVAGTTAFTKILNVTKAAAWTGNATLTSNAATVTNLLLFPAEYARQYQTVEILSTPTTGDVIEYSFLRKPTTLVNDNDIPDIPFPFSRILVWDTLIMMAGYITDIGKVSVPVWSKMQQDFELQMLQTFQQGNTLGAQPHYVRQIAETNDWWY